MKTRTGWSFIGVIVCGVIAHSAPLHAQAAGPSPAPEAGPNAAEPAPSAAPEAGPSPAETAPSPAGSDDAPWNRGVPEVAREAARAMFLEGNRLFKIPLFAQAAEKYAEALDRWRHPAFHFNLALAQLNLGQDAEAHDSLEQAARYGAGTLGPAELAEARRQLAELERRLGRLSVSCPTPGAEVTLDGVALLTGPGRREVWVKAQAHEITAKRQAYVTQVKRVSVAPGAANSLELSLRKLVEERPWAVWKPWAVVGAGALVAAGGGALHALSARDFRAYDDGFRQLWCAASGCLDSPPDADYERLNTQLRRAEREQKLAVGGYIAGGALIAAGAALVYLNRPHLADQEEPGPRGPGVALSPVVTPSSLGVLVTVSH